MLLWCKEPFALSSITSSQLSGLFIFKALIVVRINPGPRCDQFPSTASWGQEQKWLWWTPHCTPPPPPPISIIPFSCGLISTESGFLSPRSKAQRSDIYTSIRASPLQVRPPTRRMIGKVGRVKSGLPFFLLLLTLWHGLQNQYPVDCFFSLFFVVDSPHKIDWRHVARNTSVCPRKGKIL